MKPSLISIIVLLGVGGLVLLSYLHSTGAGFPVACILAFLCVIFYLWWLGGVTQQSNMQILMMMLLLEKELYEQKRDGLKELVRHIKVKNGSDLAALPIEVGLAYRRLANLSASSLRGQCMVRLWELKQSTDESEKS